MLLKKSESFLLILTLGLFLFSCTVEQNRKRLDPNSKLTGDEYKVTIEIVNTQSIEKSYFKFEGTLDGNPIYIPDDTAGIGKQEIQLASNGKLRVTVRAYSFASGEITATGYAEKDISGNISFDIVLKKVADDELFYLTFNNEGKENRKSYFKNETVGELSSPIRDGYIFGGWFTQPNGEGVRLTTTWSMTANLTVYAYWISENSNVSVICSFDTDGGSTVDSQTVLQNSSIDKPENPIKSGYTFTGWYLDKECTQLVSFPYTVTKNITLYAGWVSSESVVKVTGVKLTETSYIFNNVGKTINLVYVIEPPEATNKSVSWSSSNPNVAKVNNGEVTSVGVGMAEITVTTADGGYTATCSITVKGEQEIAVTGVTLNETTKSLEKGATFTLTATVSPENATNKSVKWTTSNPSVATVNGGKVTAIAKGTATITATTTDGAKNASCYVTVIDPLAGKTIVFVKADSAPHIWAWENNGTALSEKLEGTWGISSAATLMTAADAKYMNDPTGWYMMDFTSVASFTGKTICFKLNWLPGGDGGETVGLAGTFWYDGSNFYDEDPTTPVIVEPTKPTVSISPASGNISVSGSVRVTFTDGNDTITSARVTINGSSYDMGTIAGTFTKSVKDLGITSVGTSLSVKATVTNGVGTTTAEATLTTTDTPVIEDTFTWSNALVYFVITDRFNNGNTSNDTSYGRIKQDCKGKNIGTFHGGDIAGLTQKLDYLDDLGVNAIWITAPYEQIHGWVGGGNNGDFAHYAYHGYYVLDYTGIDKNMGTVEEFRTFVTECHKRGIRVVMDIVMNHTGYENMKDMEEYGYGSLTAGANFSWLPNSGETFHQKPIDKNGSNWDKFWGRNWIRGGFNGYDDGGSDDLKQCLNFLPDFKTESTNSESAPAILKTKWSKETSGYDDWIIPAAKNLRKDLGLAPAVYIEKWLAAWVEEFGIDGFRCDTAKHVDKYRWGELKNLCKTALSTWRQSSRADEYAKNWDEDFWMTGESFGWCKDTGDSSWFSNGFDSMIDFSVAGRGGMGTYSPNLPDWSNRLGGSQALLYMSSHDTGLGRSSNQSELGTSFVLMPGLVQIYYGDETSRPFGESGSDGDQGTRSDMNWDAVDGNVNKHWKKVGTFRKYNPAVGAGTGSAYKRTYSGAAGESKVAIGVNGSSVDVSGLFDDGTTVYNWYDGKSATVSGGKVTSFSGGTMKQPILISDKNPADCKVAF